MLVRLLDQATDAQQLSHYSPKAAAQLLAGEEDLEMFYDRSPLGHNLTAGILLLAVAVVTAVIGKTGSASSTLTSRVIGQPLDQLNVAELMQLRKEVL